MTKDENPRIADTLKAEVLSASVAGQNQASVTFKLSGEFERDGAKVEVDVVIVSTVPASIRP